MPLSLLFRAIAGLLVVSCVIALALFFTAGTTQYWQAWLYLACFFASNLAVTIYFSIRNPALIRRRMVWGGKAELSIKQKGIVRSIQLLVLSVFIVSGLDQRMGWSQVSTTAVLAGDGLLLVAFVILFVVFRHNSFTAATVTIEKDQRVVDTGPYAVVRHPMYAGSLVLIAGTAPALGSWWSLVLFLPFLLVMIARLRDEEDFLIKNLPGYAEYQAKVRWRLVPGVY